LSRKWERMVARNRAELNQRREKQGLGKVTSTGTELTFKGRSYLFPFVLLVIASLYGFINISAGDTNTLFWVTIALYLLLCLYFFFIRRPYLKFIGNEIMTRKLGRERTANLADIEKIVFQRGTVVITIKDERTEWFFSRGMQLFQTNKMADHLEKIAQKRNIPFERMS